MTYVVVDTNVGVVCNGHHPEADPGCIESCRTALARVIKKHDRLVLDRQQHIVEEYVSQLSPSGQPGLGDEFFIWVLRNQWDPQVCEVVDITPDAQREFAEFPQDPDLASFDRSDRKFVAAALASQQAPDILNAVDSDWWDHRLTLARHGVRLRFLCPNRFGAKEP